MKYDLIKPFQEKALDDLLNELNKAQKIFPITNESEIIPFTAPTGAGKTIMAAALIEAIYCGYSVFDGSKDSIILWLSDSEKLNKQSMEKIINFADKLVNNQCILLNDSFKGEILEDGKIYFANTQKFGKGNRLVTRREDRPYVMWEVFHNTIEKKGKNLILIIDEAHRGARKNEAKDQMSIMQRFLRGYEETDEQGVKIKMESFPIIVGMSATLKRFEKLIESCNELQKRKTVEVTAEDLRKSGLIKENIELHIPEKPSFVEMSYLRDAACEWKNKCEHWEAYKKHEPDKDVKPILIVQVENSDGQNITKTDLGECLKQIQDATGITLKESEVVHAFDSESTLDVDGFHIPFVSSETIESDKNIKVVFFKDALSTGWDCPRAEAMMSFRAASDDTYIAQLLGRMVRTPLHKRIETDDSLNNVHLFLPKFNKANAEAIVAKLKEEGVASDAHVNSKEMQILKPIGLLTNGYSRENIWEALNNAKIYSYSIPKNGVHNYLKAVFRLSYLIRRVVPCKDIIKDLKESIAIQIHDYIDILKKNGTYKDEIKKINSYIDNQNEVKFDVITRGEMRSLTRSFYDLDNWFNFADTLLGKEGISLTYMSLYDEEYDDTEIRCHIISFTQDANQMKQLSEFCKNKFGELNDLYKENLQTNLKDKEEYKRIMNDEIDTAPHFLSLKDELNVSLPEKSKEYEDHLYCDDNGKAKFVLNEWEEHTLIEERKRPDYVCWLRNMSSREESLCIQYRRNGKIKPMFPDFIIVRKGEDNNFLFDILEPHRDDLDDNIYKAKGLCEYSKQCLSIKRCEMIRQVGKGENYSLLRLDMAKTNIYNDVVAAADDNALNGLFTKYNS